MSPIGILQKRAAPLPNVAFQACLWNPRSIGRHLEVWDVGTPIEFAATRLSLKRKATH